ncbi:hypothetical protein SAMN05216167_12711 [Spirosoma endophyticum]|uniref:Uncharacterized protein n=1 Tax=Spirosoma endophyticum TaxID=662367 RepID=A0A1I2FQ98_9BACT|nr:hypothetical protein SAMN05216167_12711 [Spirosoma endophyticum]
MASVTTSIEVLMLKLLAAMLTVVLVLVLFVAISDEVSGKAMWTIDGSLDFDHQGKLSLHCFLSVTYHTISYTTTY